MIRLIPENKITFTVPNSSFIDQAPLPTIAHTRASAMIIAAVVNLLGGFLLVGHNIPCRIGLNVDIISHPTQ